MKTNATDITFLLDRTGSMADGREDTIGGFNTFLADQQKADGDCRFTLIQFDSQDANEIVHDAVPIRDVPPLTFETFVPRAATPLLDAAGHAIVQTGQRLKAMSEDERPEHVIFVILTDGLENASHEYTRDKLVKMIEHQKRKYNWDFIFLGAEIDAIKEGGNLSIGAADALMYSKSPAGTASAMRALSDKVLARRKGRQRAFSDEERAASSK